MLLVRNKKKTGYYVTLRESHYLGNSLGFLPSKGQLKIRDDQLSTHLETLQRSGWVKISSLPNEPESLPEPVVEDED